jgi:hypothetical protein
MVDDDVDLNFGGDLCQASVGAPWRRVAATAESESEGESDR